MMPISVRDKQDIVTIAANELLASPRSGKDRNMSFVAHSVILNSLERAGKNLSAIIVGRCFVSLKRFINCELGKAISTSFAVETAKVLLKTNTYKLFVLIVARKS